jgi:multidrug transporter EmrE-like cation transporter
MSKMAKGILSMSIVCFIMSLVILISGIYSLEYSPKNAILVGGGYMVMMLTSYTLYEQFKTQKLLDNERNRKH